MITRIEIDGFKTFQDFAVDLAPFQVIIGPNGCGKSNFFDALDLLSKLADSALRPAFKSIRGNINELFTVLPNGKSVDRMRFAVEMIAQYLQQEDMSVKYVRMRYEIEIRQRTKTDGFEQLYVYNERLVSMLPSEDLWRHKHADFLDKASFTDEDQAKEWLKVKHDVAPVIQTPRGESVTTSASASTEKGMVFYFSPELLDRQPNYAARSLLSSSFPGLIIPVDVARHELRNLGLVRLDIRSLLKPSSYADEVTLSSTGENLPATLAWMQTYDKHLLRSVSRDVSSIVPNFAQIEVDRDEGRKQIALYAHTRDKRRFSIDALSEGTLRILALATLRNDPQQGGTLCFEDPEMGVHPGLLERIVRLLRGMATDLNDPEYLKLPLRQVLVTTHSPELVSHLNIEQGELLFVTTPIRVVPGGDVWQVTRFTSVCADNKQGPDQTYALSNVIAYLNNPDAAAKREMLRETMRR